MLIPAVIGFFFNVLLNYILIPFYGKTGAAVASALSYFLLALSYIIIGQKIFPLHVDWPKMTSLVIVFIISIIMISFCSLFDKGMIFWRFIILCMFSAACYFLKLIPVKDIKKLLSMLIKREVAEAAV